MFKTFFNDVSIKVRLTTGYIIIILFTLTIFIVGQISLTKSVQKAEDAYKLSTVPLGDFVEFAISYGNLRCAARDIINYDKYDEKLTHKATIETSFNSMSTILKRYNQSLDQNSEKLDERVLKLSSEFSEAIDSYEKLLMESLVPHAMNNEKEFALNVLNANMAKDGSVIRNNMQALVDEFISDGKTHSNEIKELRTTLIILQSILIALSILIATLLAFLTTKSIIAPINYMMKITDQISKGNLNLNCNINSNDEVGNLSKNLSIVVTTLHNIINSLNKMSKEHKVGEIDERINELEFNGAFREVVSGINEMVNDHIYAKKTALQCISNMASGDFESDIPKFAGKRIFINHIIDDLRANLKKINSDISLLIEGAVNGNLSVRVDSTTYNGDWVKLMNGLNELLNTVINPINEASNVLSKIAKGDLSAKMTGNYKGEFLELKENINYTTGNISDYIKEISYVLGEISNNNLNVGIKREYIGDFTDIKDALNNIVDKLNDFMNNIAIAAEQVSAGSKQISESSMSLAQGATEQTSSVEQLALTTNSINEKTKISVASSKSAVKLSEQSKENASLGSNEMHNMLIAMENIKESSSNIYKIIKVIEDIAFQTNLLALNAAVESARAGEHGKGFAVVAEEVRNLASRSTIAAKETSELIKDSLGKVSDGTDIATATSEALEKIVGNITQVSSIISDISSLSEEQSESISKINEGLVQISKVAHSTTSTSEENASSSEELSSQSEILTNMLLKFNLKH